MKLFNIARRHPDRLDLNPQPAAEPRQSKAASASTSTLPAVPSDAYVARSAAGSVSEGMKPAAAQPSIDWQGNLEKRRSRFGVNGGAHFVSDGNSLLAAKWAPTLGQEIMAYHLAAHVGLPTPFLRVESRPNKALRSLLDSGKAPVMLMRYLPGHCFRELGATDEAHFKHGGAPLRDLGRLAAFDYLLQNQDRFPLEGLEGDNPGNLLLVGGRVYGIDHTLPTLLADAETRQYRKTLATVLQLVADPNDAKAAACLQGLGNFLPQQWGLSWASMRDEVVAGFVEQAQKIGSMSDA
ncbi:MAG: hypothetical protein EOO40_07150, partial [Deltaproteobacteria bacterium]